MASVESIPPINNASELEEGEVIDDIDELSDISSEEEFLLRQRLQVLENYNNVLERKKAKKASILSGKNEFRTNMLLDDLSEISANELEENTYIHNFRQVNAESSKKLSNKHKKCNVHSGIGRCKDNKKRSRRKKKVEAKVINESSEESDDEYKNKRRKLADAVTLNKAKSDTSTLKDRLERMLCGSKKDVCKTIKTTKDLNCTVDKEKINSVQCNEINIESNQFSLKDDITSINIENECIDIIGKEITKQNKQTQVSLELIDLCSEDNSNFEIKENDVVDSSNKENLEEQDMRIQSHKQDSDDDLEILRQHALKTKNLKVKTDKPKVSETEKSKPLSEDYDSDTSELRRICLKSALLKKAIERKFKQKMRKRLKSKSMSMQDELYDQGELKASEIENNTDIESVDMDIGSDAEDKNKDSNGNMVINRDQKSVKPSNIINNNTNKYDDLEEDEDLLRAKLLTSLSKNLPNLVDMDILDKTEDVVSADDPINKAKPSVEEKKFIINLRDSDSEAEHESTKNLTKMHIKLSEQVDFQQKLGQFLKSTREQVESTMLPDVVQQPVIPKQHVKYVPKAVNHLPKSEQIEYKNLVKRMAELEKIKQARQTSINTNNNSPFSKETLKPRNAAVDTKNTLADVNIEDKIAVSRKNIAEESAKMLKLKEEAKKLSQKYKIVTTELRNISTAITLNKKEQRTVQNKLSRIRAQHQMLLKGSNFKHSTGVSTPVNQLNAKTVVCRLQKENNPTKGDHRFSTMLKAVTVSVVNDFRKDNVDLHSKISVQVDVGSNKKSVKIPKSPDKERIVNYIDDSDTYKRKTTVVSKELNFDTKDVELPSSENIGTLKRRESKDLNDYESPLQAFGSTTWEEDPNAVLCPYEVAGSCRDPGCKFLHPKAPRQ